MEFLNINLTKYLNLLFHAIHSPFYWWKTILFSGFTNPCKKIRKTRKIVSIHEQYFVERKNEGRKPDETGV
jgi:hypothetical protein